METSKAEKELRLRLYRWALAEAMQEAETGYPLLKCFWDDATHLYIYIAEAQPPAKRLLLASACVKHFHPEAVRLAEEHLTDSEQEMLSYSSNLIRYHLTKGTAVKLRYGEKELSQWPPLSRQHLASVLRDSMAVISKELIGSRQHITRVELNYEREVGDWRFRTGISTRPSGFGCVHGLIDHNLSAAGELGSQFPLSHFTYCSLLGVTGLGWTVYNEKDAEMASVGLVKVCLKVLIEIPPLLEGL